MHDTTSEACPAFNFGQEAPSAAVGNSPKFCTSALEMHLYPLSGGTRSVADLQDHPYCIPQSVDPEVASVVSRDICAFLPCGSSGTSVKMA